MFGQTTSTWSTISLLSSHVLSQIACGFSRLRSYATNLQVLYGRCLDNVGCGRVLDGPAGGGLSGLGWPIRRAGFETMLLARFGLVVRTYRRKRRTAPVLV